MRIAIAQINPLVGDLAGNARLIERVWKRAAGLGADMAVFPELSLCGYPPRDLVEDPVFVRRNREALEKLATHAVGTAALVGFVDRSPAHSGRPIANAAALLHRGQIAAVRHKTLLPTYDVFDELRHFEPAGENAPVVFGGQRLGITICEDMWNVPGYLPMPYQKDPVAALARQGADLLLNLSSSPFHRRKGRRRLDLVRHHVERFHRPFVFVNQVGGNDELLFDGNSLALNSRGELIAQAKAFQEDLVVVETAASGANAWRDLEDMAEMEAALVMGTRDYFRKCGFSKAVLGLSGGIDSAVTAVLAVRALGASQVLGVLMPSEFSSKGSVRDAKALAKGLGIRTVQLPITPAFRVLKQTLRPAFKGLKPDVTEENLQARIRGVLLMALSNKLGALLLTTGNKSEISMGYCTLYGDMNGGLAVISDVPKTLVYGLGRHLNRKTPVIPEATFTKPPSAELRPDQTDQDTLPPYDVLDAIIEAYVEDRETPEAIMRRGFNADLVRRVLDTIDRNEYKRRQAAPGLRISPKAFGLGRRLPIARGSYR